MNLKLLAKITKIINGKEKCVKRCKSSIGGSRDAATFKMECFVIIVNGSQPFLVLKTPNRIDTKIYRNKTNSDLYIHCNSFTQNKWKWRTIKNLVHKVYDTWSTDQYLEIELKHIRPSFNKMNGYPHWIISRVFNEIKEKQLNQ